MMWFYDAWDNNTAWLYFATHGGYGLMWVLKSSSFGDKQWEQRCSAGYGALIWGGLSLYWIAPWIIVSQGLKAPGWVMGVCVLVSWSRGLLSFCFGYAKTRHSPIETWSHHLRPLESKPQSKLLR